MDKYYIAAVNTYGVLWLNNYLIAIMAIMAIMYECMIIDNWYNGINNIIVWLCNPCTSHKYICVVILVLGIFPEHQMWICIIEFISCI